jgi:hypothetical protein
VIEHAQRFDHDLGSNVVSGQNGKLEGGHGKRGRVARASGEWQERDFILVDHL